MIQQQQQQQQKHFTPCISFSSLARVIAVSRGSWNLMAIAGNTLVLE